MTPIILKYRRFFIPFTLNAEIPVCWNDVSAKQLIAISRLYNDEITDNELISIMCDIPLRIVNKLTTYERYRLANVFSFVTDFKPFHSFIIKDIYGYFPPRPKLEGMIWEQFMFTDTYYNNWAENGLQTDLDKFFACLYQKKGEAFDSSKIELYLSENFYTDNELKIAVSINYRLVKEWLTDAYPMVFQRPGEAQESKGKNKGWLPVFESIVGDDIINQDKYAKLTVHTVLKYLTKKIKENARG